MNKKQTLMDDEQAALPADGSAIPGPHRRATGKSIRASDLPVASYFRQLSIGNQSADSIRYSLAEMSRGVRSERKRPGEGSRPFAGTRIRRNGAHEQSTRSGEQSCRKRQNVYLGAGF